MARLPLRRELTGDKQGQLGQSLACIHPPGMLQLQRCTHRRGAFQETEPNCRENYEPVAETAAIVVYFETTECGRSGAIERKRHHVGQLVAAEHGHHQSIHA
jgi:hypothetical protein